MTSRLGMKLLIVLFISSLLVLSIACASEEEAMVTIENKQQIQKLVSEVQLLREEVNQLKCHFHTDEYSTSYPRMDTTPPHWSSLPMFPDNPCPKPRWP